jgi:type II secretory pathway pseudopilin PulG
MKRHLKTIAGVTLLEIMLVLAVASMVIVMSIRYYQNAQNSENTNIIMEQIQNISAAADNLAQGAGTYSAATTSAVSAIAGSNNMITPYAGTIVVSGGSTSYSVNIPSIPSGVCTNLAAKLKANSKFSVVGTCGTSGTTSLAYTYTSSS